MTSFIVGDWLIIEELRQMDRYLDLLNSAIGENKKQLEASIEEIAKSLVKVIKRISTRVMQMIFPKYQVTFQDYFFPALLLVGTHLWKFT